MQDKIIKIESISKSYSDNSGQNVKLFEDLSFDIKQCSVTTILSSSGLEKTELLKTIAFSDEVEKTDGSRIYIPTEASSFPWLNVLENITFNLKEVDESILNSIIKLVGLSGYEDHYPNNKSVGFRFRISLARAIIRNPELIIVDGSISKLSVKRRVEIFTLLRQVAQNMKTAILYASSSVSDAIRISDKIILLQGTPLKIESIKTILIDEEVRSETSAIISPYDYFDAEELALF